MKVVILAGGYGKRLRPMTDKTPKPLLPVSGKPILFWQIKWLKHFGLKEIILCVGHLKERIIEEIGDGEKYGVNVEYAIEEKPLGTGGALKNAEKILSEEDRFLMVNGDILTDLNPLKVIDILG